MEAKVDDICEAAGVSTPTFYTFYTSKRELCVDAFVELDLVRLETAGVPRLPFQASVEALLAQCEGFVPLGRWGGG